VVTGQAQPSRRLLRELARAAPQAARDFVVATGDAISFNTIYRDRQATWQIQDLPFNLVFFCHHNPTDPEAGFRPLSAPAIEGEPESGREDKMPSSQAAATGTEDVLLFGDIVEALILAWAQGDQTKAATIAPASNPGELRNRLREIRWLDGRVGYDSKGIPLFRPDGQRVSGTGEHVVLLRPVFQGERVLPRALLEVWAWRTTPDHGRIWLPFFTQPLPVSYEEASGQGGEPHGGG
jgi:hypothetical protein